MKAINYACFKLEENRLDLIDLLKRIKIILSTLKEINLPSVIDKENYQFPFVRTFSVIYLQLLMKVT